MKKIYLLLSVLIIVFSSCSKDDNDHNSDYNPNVKIEVVQNGCVYNTNAYNRIGYSLKTWQYEKDGLKLEKIQALDKSNDNILVEISTAEFDRIYKPPLSTNPYFVWDSIDSYYMSIQIPVSLSNNIPDNIYHRMYFRDTIHDISVNYDGGEFSPITNVKPIVIGSPVKGKNLVFVNQSVITYHFDVLLFLDNEIYTPERYAVDQMQLESGMINYYDGDPEDNTSYFCYGDTLYAVADGVVYDLVDDLPENNGNLANVQFVTANEMAGNYLILDIGGNHYAFYAHIIPGSFMVSKGENVLEGQPIALIGNSGNSTAPHLHFHIADNSDFWRSNGVPFVFKECTIVGNWGLGPLPEEKIHNALTEETMVVNIDF